MSNSKLREVVLILIRELLNMGVITHGDLLQLAGSTSFAKIEIKERIDYVATAQILTENRVVFLPVDRKTAYYAQHRLQKILNTHVERIKGEWGSTSGYFFSC